MIEKGTKVKWKWGNGVAYGKVKSIFEHKVERKIKGNIITRNGTVADKAIYIEQEDGGHVLKLESEVEKT
ncbi:MAG: hypothetical protein CL868_03620 [Cytophagaceae bacterium]|nr:hypothetical protein [Cytophagaceae bacterium]|tara:strand:+ start:229 stop:438 length:210 start_codon:yes stop_codon:yes gene_type:complete